MSIERKSKIQEKRKLMIDKRQIMGMKSSSVTRSTVLQSEEPRSSFTHMKKRHKMDTEHVVHDFEDAPPLEYTPVYQAVFDDDRDPMLEPTFSKHRIPLPIRCLERYHNNKREYSRQFKREIQLLIDNQPTAESAWQFIRTMSYTTLWPPLHTRTELKAFEKDFCKLSRSEQNRYNKIMSTNFS